MTARYTGPDARTRGLCYERDSYCCQWCGNLDCGPLQLQHRRARGMGGSRLADTNSATNLVTVGEICHDYIERKRDVARSFGFNVRQGQDPATVPIRLVGGWVLLQADGSTQASAEAS